MSQISDSEGTDVDFASTCILVLKSIDEWLKDRLPSEDGKDNLPEDIFSDSSGLKEFFRWLETVPQENFFSGIADTKVYFLYDLPKLLTLVANLLLERNDISFLTFLCTAEGFLDLWLNLKLQQGFEKLRFIRRLSNIRSIVTHFSFIYRKKRMFSKKATEEFQVKSMLLQLMRSYPGNCLSSFKFAFSLMIERIDFLHADPQDFTIMDVLGKGSDGYVR